MKFLVITIERDITSSYLIKWLIYYSIPFVRINLNDIIYSINVLIESGNEVLITINNKRIKVSDFSIIAPNSKDSIDYITYQSKLRYVPYKLPKEVEKRIILLMSKLDLISGSIDIIKKYR